MTQTNGTNGTPQPQTQALTPYQERRMALREEIDQDSTPRAIVPRTFAEAQAFAEAIAYSSLVPNSLKERAPDILMIVLAGGEVGIPPIKALSLYHVIEGVPKLGADGIAAVCTASPLCEYLRPLVQSDDRVVWAAKRVGHPEVTLEVNKADVERAGLLAKAYSNHAKYPRQMKNARCKAELCRLVWPEICAGMLSAEEAREAADIAEANAQRAGIPATLEAPPPPPPAPPAASSSSQSFPRDTTKQGDATPAGGKPPKSTSKAKPPIDAQSSEQKSPSSTPPPSSSAPASAAVNSSAGADRAEASGELRGPLASPATASTTQSSESSSSTAPAPSEASTGAPTSPESGSSATAADDAGGFGGDDATADEEPAITLAGFRAALERATRETIAVVKEKWVPYSLKGQPLFEHAGEMRKLFAARNAELNK